MYIGGRDEGNVSKDVVPTIRTGERLLSYLYTQTHVKKVVDIVLKFRL